MKFVRMLFASLFVMIAFASQAQAALTIDTTGIEADISTAGASGLTIVLAVAGVAIGIALVRKLIRA